jgi:hypothetical protein
MVKQGWRRLRLAQDPVFLWEAQKYLASGPNQALGTSKSAGPTKSEGSFIGLLV